MVSDNLLTLMSNKYSFEKDTLHFISESTNQIYAFQKNDKRYILRFSQRPAEQIHQIKAEMDWLYYLANKEIGVSLPFFTDSGEIAVSMEDGGKNYIVSAFEVLSGQFWNKNDPNLWNEKIFFNWGKLLGDMHRLTKDYVPSNAEDIRITFTGWDECLIKLKDCSTLNKILEELISEIMALPKGKDSYGLIHCDVHPWNFLINGEQINVFDFDDSLYGWFALDIGVALYHALWWGRKDDAGNDFTNIIIKRFIEGYLSANHLSDFWLSKIPMFMRYRQICKLSWFYDSENSDDHQKERIYNIENGILFTECEINPSLFLSQSTCGVSIKV